MKPVAFWQRWWSGDRDKDRKYHSNQIIPNFGGINISGIDWNEEVQKGPQMTDAGQWTEVVPLFVAVGISGSSHGG